MDVKTAPTLYLQQSKEGETKKTSTCHSSEEIVLTETLIAGANCNVVFIPHTECMLSLGTQQWIERIVQPYSLTATHYHTC